MENRFHKFKCPCCGYFTLPEQPSNTFEICPVCFWEDDGLQYDNPDYTGGANKISLNEARRNYKELGVSDQKYMSKVRSPLAEEQAEGI